MLHVIDSFLPFSCVASGDERWEAQVLSRWLQFLVGNSFPVILSVLSRKLSSFCFFGFPIVRIK